MGQGGGGWGSLCSKVEFNGVSHWESLINFPPLFCSEKFSETFSNIWRNIEDIWDIFDFDEIPRQKCHLWNEDKWGEEGGREGGGHRRREITFIIFICWLPHNTNTYANTNTNTNNKINNKIITTGAQYQYQCQQKQ